MPSCNRNVTRREHRGAFIMLAVLAIAASSERLEAALKRLEQR